MSKLRLAVLGQPRIEKDGAPVEINRRKAIALLTYLAVTGESQTRDRLAGLFWPHENRARSRAALRRTLTAIRHAVGSEWLVVEGEKIGIRPGGDLWLDVRQFDSLLSKYQAISAHGDEESADSLALLTEVARLYRTDFLAQFALDSNTDFNEWQFLQTESLRRRFSDALARLVAAHARRQELELSIAYARRRLGLDPLDEACHRSLMRLYAASGRSSVALRTFKECRRRLQRELGVEPDPATVALYEAIKARKAVDAVEPGSDPGASSPLPRAGRPRGPGRKTAGARRRLLIAVAAGAALAAAASAGFLFVHPAPGPVALAVIPIEARDAGGSADSNLDGMTDALLAELARVPRFRVKSPLAMRPFRGTVQAAGQIGRALAVDWLVSGSILRSGSSVRVSLALIGVKDDTTAWAEVFTRDSADAARTQGEIAAEAAAAIRRHFGIE